jgi:hypothetical protein
VKRKFIAVIVCLLVMSNATAFAQTRQRRTQGGRTTKAQASRNSKASATSNASDGATRVGDQIKTLTRFLYLLGGVARGIEAADDAARRSEASPATLAQTERSKETVRTSLENVRQGLDKLEIDFRSSPELQRYYSKLAGVAAGAATAEDQAAANHYDQAGRSLLEVVNRLTDVLLLMH